METAHCQDLAVVFGELNTVNSGKKLLEVSLDDGRLRGLAQNFQQVIITNKIEAREGRPFLLQREGRQGGREQHLKPSNFSDHLI